VAGLFQPTVRCVQCVLAAFALLLASCQSVLVHEARSPFSHIQIRDGSDRRAMYFIGEGGAATLETLIDLRQPHRLQLRYTRTMMAGLLYGPDPRAVLLIGLGGGAIARFLNHEYPRMQLDVVEIDPVVVALAREYFGTVPGERTRIFTEDAVEYLRRTGTRYDLILVDAHLVQGAETNATGLPQRLAAQAFLANLRERLTPGGVAVFNLIDGQDTHAGIALIRGTFMAVDVYQSSPGNVIAVALTGGGRPPDNELRERAQALDRSADRGFSFEHLLDERENLEKTSNADGAKNAEKISILYE